MKPSKYDLLAWLTAAMLIVSGLSTDQISSASLVVCMILVGRGLWVFTEMKVPPDVVGTPDDFGTTLASGVWKRYGCWGVMRTYGNVLLGTALYVVPRLFPQ